MPLAKIADLAQNIEDLQPYIDVAKRLSNLYDDYLENIVEDPGERAPGLHASELSKCVRQAYYSLTGLEKHNSVNIGMRKRFSMGHAVHAMVQRDLHKVAAIAQAERVAQANGWYLEFSDEVKIGPKHQELAARYEFHSSCDGVFTFRDLEHAEPVLRVGLEIKTESPDNYDELKKPRKDHVAQAHIYMACLDLPLLWFYYMNKGNQNSTPSSSPWLIPFNPEIWLELESRAQTALSHAATKTEPVREEGFHCGFCPYSWRCQPGAMMHRQSRFISVRRP